MIYISQQHRLILELNTHCSMRMLLIHRHYFIDSCGGGIWGNRQKPFTQKRVGKGRLASAKGAEQCHHKAMLIQPFCPILKFT